MTRIVGEIVLASMIFVNPAQAQAGSIAGVVRDDTGAPLPGVTVELFSAERRISESVTGATGDYRFDGIGTGVYSVRLSLVNFSRTRRDVTVEDEGIARGDVVMHLTFGAAVTVTGKSSFGNLADAERPAESLIGIAQSASQGAITGRQLDARPIMRSGEVLETVPGVIVTQHSGEGKANQYYLRGFNLDHGTDFATTVAGMPVNMPTHAHGQGYSDLNFLIPELISGVQYSKGPYFTDQGDFATAGAANINYVNMLGKPLIRVAGGGEGFTRALIAAAPRAGRGHLLAALEVEHNDGPWTRSDDYRKVNGVVRYSIGNSVNGMAFTGMGYRGTWNSTDQIPRRTVDAGRIGRFGAIDPTDGGSTYRYSGSVEWQQTRGDASTKVTGYALAYDVDLFSNFTYFLDDPVHGDQFHQEDHRFVSGASVTHRRLATWTGRAVQNTLGAQLRNDDIATVGLFHTEARRLLETTRRDSVLQTSLGGYAQNEIQWTGWLRSLAGVRADGYRFKVDAGHPLNGGLAAAGVVSPKGGLVLGPFKGTEIYANAGSGFHSNDARGATITVDPVTGEPADRVTPLVRAIGAEVGIRSVAIPHLQTTFTAWTLNLASEQVFLGDAGTTEAGRPSHRAGFELANYYRPRRWLTLDADVSISRARFTNVDPAGDRIPGSLATVVSAGATIDSLHSFFGSVRLRYFGPRPLIEDDSVRSKGTTLVNVDGGWQFAKGMRIAVDVFNLLNAKSSDIDYFYRSRLPSEPPDGIADVHFHPMLPRSARVTLMLGF